MCESFVVQMTKTDHPMYHNLSIEDFAVLREFWDMFPKEILGLPPKRDINFTINLIPRSTLVSKEPYQMSIPKLTELRMQLKGLLDRKYSCPSVSPWGSLVLFLKKKDGTYRLCIDY